ncbi:fumarylacetoacetate hydrolase family protein [Rhodococcoides yunnanense]|uniref:Fumarylacetoacetate hydrolase family protein n=1 Tax=Rhodococcoides yunnanense TaxID=278209 RepID=A0ABU4BCH3_9NOCA|nr:fumarylacetoacetate hydrolase family protein [Rhodococcus yunnanensis]MDV6261880.1 fumarylacetoacetate hydrolase family protein [Rhodococcus yunnanensis]
MKIRRVRSANGVVLAAWDPESTAWIDLDAAASKFDTSRRGPWTTDLLTFLASRESGREAAERLMRAAAAEDVARLDDPPPGMPYQPTSLRCFMGWEKHWSQAAHQLVRKNLPILRPAIAAYESVVRRDFPALRPGASFDEHPVYYTGNPLSIVADGEILRWPAYTRQLDFELEFAMIIDRPVLDATEDEGSDAIGGFVVFNDMSARDVQWDEQRNGPFGPVVKTKTFGSSMGSVVVTPDEVLPHLGNLSASVSVNGETWTTTSTSGLRYSPGESIAYASRAENLYPGELFSSGTLPSGCGLELDRWIRPGDALTLEIEAIGSVTNEVGFPGR